MLRVPTPANPSYGYMWWLNTGQQSFPSAPEAVFYAAGFGGNYIVVDQEHDLVIAVRWAGSSKIMDGIIKRVLAALHLDQHKVSFRVLWEEHKGILFTL